MSTKRLTVDLDKDLYHEFSVRVAEEEVTKADVVRNCVSEFVDETDEQSSRD